MGCHTWFSRPVTEEEHKLMREWALKDAEEIFGDNTKNRELEKETGEHYINLYNIGLVKRSLETGERCYYGLRWDEAGFGLGHPELKKRFYGKSPNLEATEGKLYFDCSIPYWGNKELESILTEENMSKVDFPFFHDAFRIENYPRKVIHNRRELRRYLGKKYFELTDFQKARVSKFFEIYPGGVITFG